MATRKAFIARIAPGTLGVALASLLGCAYSKEAEQAYQLASTVGKNAVQLTDDVEFVQGRCSFVFNIVADDEPMGRPTEAQLPDYFKTQAVLAGADTVLVRGRTGEAYICGPAPLNPDGTRRAVDPPR
jgi:hypothetical protein